MVFASKAYSQPDWKKYEYPDQKFNISFPQVPEFEIDTSDFNGSFLYDYFWGTSIDDENQPNTYYSVGLISYPPEYIHSDSALDLVEGFINSSQTSLEEDEDYIKIYSQLIEFKGYPGKIFRWKNKSSDACLEFRVFLVQNHLFELILVTRAGSYFNKEGTNFFNSFELNGLEDGTFIVPMVEANNRLKIDFPGTATTQNQLVDSPYGKLNLDMKIYEPKDESDVMVYISMETIYPEGSINPSDSYDLNSFYKSSIDGSMASVNAQLISITDIEYKGHPGKEYRCYYGDGIALMNYRLFYIDDHFYTFGVITTPKKEGNKTAKRFLNSFSIND
ncbi:MAG: hypothetical protein IPH84_16110 [Bacteroidales bacterium]|nr:hypothetical protein [Bacteroidales bacterium]